MSNETLLRLSVQGLRFGWESGISLLDVERFNLQAGQSVLLHGPSGSGKSTFLNIVTGMLAPNAGSVMLGDQDLWALNGAKRDQLRARAMGVITQHLNLVPYLTVVENLKLMLYLAKVSVSQRDILALLTSLNLADQADQRVSLLSVGQRQRAAIARALIHSPSLIIADEPTSALDEHNAQAFMQLLREQIEQRDAALLMVTHDLSLSRYVDQSLDIRTLAGQKESVSC